MRIGAESNNLGIVFICIEIDLSNSCLHAKWQQKMLQF